MLSVCYVLFFYCAYKDVVKVEVVCGNVRLRVESDTKQILYLWGCGPASAVYIFTVDEYLLIAARGALVIVKAEIVYLNAYVSPFVVVYGCLSFFYIPI